MGRWMVREMGRGMVREIGRGMGMGMVRWMVREMGRGTGSNLNLTVNSHPTAVAQLVKCPMYKLMFVTTFEMIKFLLMIK